MTSSLLPDIHMYDLDQQIYGEKQEAQCNIHALGEHDKEKIHKPRVVPQDLHGEEGLGCLFPATVNDSPV